MRIQVMALSMLAALTVLGSGCGGDIVFSSGSSQPIYDPRYDYGRAGGVYDSGSYYVTGGDREASEADYILQREFELLSDPRFEYREDDGRTKLEVRNVFRRLMNTVRLQGEPSYREHHEPMAAGWNRIENLDKPWTSVGAGPSPKGRLDSLRLHSLEGSLAYVTYVVDGLYGDERLLSVEVEGDQHFRLKENAGLYIGFAPWGSAFTWFGPIEAREDWRAVFARPGVSSGSMIGEGLVAVAVFNGDALDLEGIHVELENPRLDNLRDLAQDDFADDPYYLIDSAEQFRRDPDDSPAPARGLPTEAEAPLLKGTMPLTEEEAQQAAWQTAAQGS